VLPHHPTCKSVGYFGAVRLRDGKFIFARELNRFDAMTTWNFLRLLQRRSLNSRRRVIVITDSATTGVSPGRGSHFFLPYRNFPLSTTLRSVPPGATCRWSVCRVIATVTPDPRAHQHAGAPFVRDAGAVVKGELRPMRNPADDPD
jgi:hypothetical protein